MFRNRVRKYAPMFERREIPEQPTVPAGFVLVPIAHLPAFAQQATLWQQQIYQVAFEQAQASVASIREYFGE